MTTKRIKHNYIDKEKFHRELTAYRLKAMEAKKNGEEKPIINNYLANCFMMLCEKLSYRPNFVNYSFREEMVGDALENCLSAVDNFNPEEQKKNPFGYFSLIAWRAFVRRIQKEHKQTYIKHKYYNESGLADELAFSSDPDTKQVNFIGNDVSNRIIEKFESKINTPKEPKKKGVEKFIEGD